MCTVLTLRHSMADPATCLKALVDDDVDDDIVYTDSELTNTNTKPRKFIYIHNTMMLENDQSR